MQKTKSTHSSIESFKFFTSNVTRSLLAVILAITLSGASVTDSQAATFKAASALAQLKVRSWSSHNGYARSAFSDGWGDLGNCDLRNYILKRDLTNISWRPDENCVVATGTLRDPYTGKVINFVRGVKTSLAVQIDHVVALSNAWVTGASVMTADKRYNIYNDPLNLLAVDGPTNQSKSDSDAASWLPPRTSYRCAYVARQIAVKRKYGLWVTSSEKAAMAAVLTKCPNQAIPAG